jgi:hypothetical protein
MTDTTTPATRVFDDTDRAVLEFERAGRWSVPGAKDREIFDRFAMTPTSYYIRLNWILNQPEAMAYDSTTVQRLQRLRDRRREVRTRGTVAAGVATRPDARGTRPALLEVVKR